MAVKTFLCVSLLVSLLVFNPDCGLQGVKASPASKTFEKQLDSLRSEYSEETSVVGSRFSGTAKFGAEYGEVRITDEIYKQDNPFNVTLSATHHDGWMVYSLSSVTTWFGGKGKVTFIDGGAGYNHWTIKWEFPRLVSANIEITVVIYLETPGKSTAAVKTERIPVEQIFKFDDMELKVKAPPEIRNEISYSKQ